MISTYVGSSAARACTLEASSSARRIAEADGVAISLRQAQQRQARLRLEPAPTCLAVRLLGGAPLASKPVDLSLSVEGLPADPFVEHSLDEALARSPRLLEGGVPSALQLHDLGAMHEADAGMGHHARLLLAPAGQGVGPLASAAQFVHALPEPDRVAVDDSCDDRRQLSSSDGHHHLVQQPETLLEMPLPDEGVTLLVYADRDQILVPEARADVGNLGRSCVSGLVFAGDRVGNKVRDAQVATLRAVLSVALE